MGLLPWARRAEEISIDCCLALGSSRTAQHGIQQQRQAVTRFQLT